MPIFYVVGALLPLASFVPWLAGPGIDIPLLAQRAVATLIAPFAWANVVVSAVVLIAFVLAESRRLGMRLGWLSLLGLAVGVSLALPLFLLLRQRHLAASRVPTRAGGALSSARSGVDGSCRVVLRLSPISAQ